jgi:ribosome-interacting GTPase 1
MDQTDLQAEIVLLTAQKNKATSYHLGQLKAKLAKLRRELISPPSGSGGGGGGLGFDVARTGIASVGVRPSVFNPISFF